MVPLQNSVWESLFWYNACTWASIEVSISAFKLLFSVGRALFFLFCFLPCRLQKEEEVNATGKSVSLLIDWLNSQIMSKFCGSKIMLILAKTLEPYMPSVCRITCVWVFSFHGPINIGLCFPSLCCMWHVQRCLLGRRFISEWESAAKLFEPTETC